MEEVVVELIKGFGTAGITAIFFIWLLSKLPTIYTNYDSFTNRNLKSLSDLTQSNTLNSSTGELISNFLAEQYLARNFKQQSGCTRYSALMMSSSPCSVLSTTQFGRARMSVIMQQPYDKELNAHFATTGTCPLPTALSLSIPKATS